jgi:hypothetical protein
MKVFAPSEQESKLLEQVYIVRPGKNVYFANVYCNLIKGV